jgi:hypothetical protein
MLNSPRAYCLGAPTASISPLPFSLNRVPATSDIDYPIGQIVVYEAGNTFYGLASKSAGQASWVHMGSTLGGPIYTLTGGSGGALSPSAAGNISLLGTASQITSSGSGTTITFSIPAAFIAPGSIVATTTVASTTTMTAGTGLTVTTGNAVVSAGNITATLGNIAASAGSISAGTTITAGTSLTATLGNITATNGNLVLNTAGNKQVYTSVAATTTAGANSAGRVTLVGGTATVSTTAVTGSSLIRLTRQSVGSTGANDLGILSVGTIVAATSFVINAWTVTDATALQADDVSEIFWEIVN